MYQKLCFVASAAPLAEEARQNLVKLYGDVPFANADCVIALGGDGLMLQTLHKCLKHAKPIFGMNRGSTGFLMNEYAVEDLPNRLFAAEKSIIHPLTMEATATDGTTLTARAFNEVSLLRQSYQAAKIVVKIDGKVRLDELVADGVLVATPVGSTAYNFSAQGPILPLNAPLMALTPLTPFRPRRWRGALLPERAKVEFEILEPEKRPVSAVADHTEVRHVSKVVVRMDQSLGFTLLHDVGHSLDERILREQFGA